MPQTSLSSFLPLANIFDCHCDFSRQKIFFSFTSPNISYCRLNVQRKLSMEQDPIGSVNK